MKIAVHILIPVLLPVFALQGNPETKVKSSIEKVTVFLDGAEITRNVETTLSKGSYELVFTGLTNSIDANSLQVKGKGDLTILSAKFQVNYLKTGEKAAKEKELEKAIKKLEKELSSHENRKNALEEEYKMITSNRKLSGEKSKITVGELRQMADFYRKHLFEIREKIASINETINELRDELTKTKRELRNINPRNYPSGEVHVKISANSPGNARFSISYFTGKAGWIPVYDLRSNDIGEPVQLHYKARVWQNTQVDWDDISLTLSSGQPTLGNYPPSFSVWWLDFAPPPKPKRKRRYQAQNKMESQDYQEPAKGRSPAGKKPEEASTPAQYTDIENRQLSTEFNIRLSYSIPADGKKHLVEIAHHELSASFRHFTMPGKDPHVYLRAFITGWEEYNLLPGTANIFFEGAYVGETMLNVDNVGDTLPISFGRDPNVLIEREKTKDFTKRQFIGGKKKETYGFEISVRNKKNKPIELTIVDQVPVSKDEDIEVTLDKRGGAAYRPETGKLTWKWELSKASDKKTRYMFTVQYPKKKKLRNW